MNFTGSQTHRNRICFHNWSNIDVLWPLRNGQRLEGRRVVPYTKYGVLIVDRRSRFLLFYAYGGDGTY